MTISLLSFVLKNSQKFFLESLIILLTVSPSIEQQYQSVNVSKVLSVYDGDTFRANIDQWPPIIGKNIAIRLNGIDTAEINGRCKFERELAIKARNFVRRKLINAEKIELTNLKRGKYFRIVANVWVDGSNLSEQILANKLAYRYNGKKKQSWCDNSHY
ncbi:MAG: thermonuclease family protein [Nitrospinota bacterium]